MPQIDGTARGYMPFVFGGVSNHVGGPAYETQAQLSNNFIQISVSTKGK